jgi:epoxyqueuosine reductase
MGQDYHRVLKSLGNELLCWIDQEFGPARGRVFTDSAPLFEREWARRAGIGWIGKNGCLILPKAGSWFFLAEIITDLEIQEETRLVPDRCGTCTRCIDACPTQALAGDRSIDPRRCISYLTIEHRSEMPEEFRGKWNDWIFGCDICQDVCPWNSSPAVSPITALEPRPELATLGDEFFSDGDPDACKRIIGGTPLERTGWLGIVRNYVYLRKDASH